MSNAVKPQCCPGTIVRWIEPADNFNGPEKLGWCIPVYSSGDVTYENVSYCPNCGSDWKSSRVWCSELPNAPGWWWFKKTPDWGAQVIYVNHYEGKLVAWTGDQLRVNPIRVPLDSPEFKDSLWAGQISPPSGNCRKCGAAG